MPIGSRIRKNRHTADLAPRRTEDICSGPLLEASDSQSSLPDEAPREEYVFRFTRDEIRDIRHIKTRHAFRPWLIHCAALIVLSLILLLCGPIHIRQHGITTSPGYSFFSFLAFVSCVKLLIDYIRIAKRWSSILKNMPLREFRYRLYDDRIIVDITGGEKPTRSVFSLDQITQLQPISRQVSMTVGATYYLLQLEGLPEDSFFRKFISPAPEPPFPHEKQKYLQLGLCGFSLLFIFLGFMLLPEKPGVAQSCSSENISNLAILGFIALMGAAYTYRVRKRLSKFAIPLAACLVAGVLLFSFAETGFRYNKATEIRRDNSAYIEIMALEEPEAFFSESYRYTDPIVCGEFAVTQALVLEYMWPDRDAVEEKLVAAAGWLPASAAETELPSDMLVDGWDYLFIYDAAIGETTDALTNGGEYIAASYDRDRASLLLVEFIVQ